MAYRVEIRHEALIDAFEVKLQSLKRAMNTSKTPEFKELYQVQITQLQKAIGSITEVK